MRALFIAAHADDVEVCAGGTIQVLTEEDYECWITTSTHHAKERTTEAVEAAGILGASYMPVSGSIRAIVPLLSKSTSSFPLTGSQ